MVPIQLRDLLTTNHKYVASKVLVSELSGQARELQILRHLNEAAPAESAQHITQLLDTFELDGPNGTHECLVFEPMGPSVNSMVEELPQFNPRYRDMKVQYPPQMARSILKQSLQGLALLHENGIAHGDFQPGNMLFTFENIDATPEEELQQIEDESSYSTSPPVKRLDGKPDKWAPRYLSIAQPLAAFTRYSEGFKIKLSDMGGAYFFTDPPAKPVTPKGLRAPELVLTGAYNKSLDIWSFGCLMFELITGEQLFSIFWTDFEDDLHLLQLTASLGPLPDDLYEQWKTSSRYFTPERKLFNCELGGVAEGEEPWMMEEEQPSMEEAFDKAAPELDEEEASVVKKLIRRILQYDVSKRPSPAELLSDPWFAGIDINGGSKE
ncbi:Non-specific serine/threonine protein kinase [Purpureocillium takamizusanense]|uniref:Non-specific serine/threonine protein kinase n=1 Tax=Purpureocillium takamizusanense TaxID=2060973 RepID=A0A9Q8QQN9_9HYPO|nr:Non-specific serine/threonine protein kinase [Purpureocillium takamizusanense]UNI23978.1 Non-specific serine/threonine protein kinase [Purpureocillium takamizusanense]